MRLRGINSPALVAMTIMVLAHFAFAQTPPTEPSSPPSPSAAEEAGNDATIRFNFKGATFEQVVDFFSRITGLPVIWETDPPEGTLDYLSPKAYDREEALHVLNVILQSRGVMLRVSEDMLHLQKLTEMQRESIPTYTGELPGEIRDEEIVTVVRPLRISLAKPLAEKLAAMVASYGSVAAMEQSNALVITETASQVRRLLEIIEQLDQEDPEGAIEIVKLRHTQATALMEPLKALLAQKVEKYVIDQQGNQVKIEEESMPGLSIAADDRTNAIIAKGVQSRIDKMKEVIALLDVPSVGTGRAIRTFSLVQHRPSDAARLLNPYFERAKPEERPVIIPIDETGALTVVGSEEQLAEIAALIRELDGGGAQSATELARTTVVIPLAEADPPAVLGSLRGLLTARQQAVVKLLAGPDERSIVASGPAEDVAAVQSMVASLDQPPPRTQRFYSV